MPMYGVPAPAMGQVHGKAEPGLWGGARVLGAASAWVAGGVT